MKIYTYNLEALENSGEYGGGLAVVTATDGHEARRLLEAECAVKGFKWVRSKSVNGGAEAGPMVIDWSAYVE